MLQYNQELRPLTPPESIGDVGDGSEGSVGDEAHSKSSGFGFLKGLTGRTTRGMQAFLLKLLQHS